MVAQSQEPAEQILHNVGIEFSTEGLPYNEAKIRGLLSWREMSAEQALSQRVYLYDRTSDSPVPMTQCEIGDWFCSEW